MLNKTGTLIYLMVLLIAGAFLFPGMASAQTWSMDEQTYFGTQSNHVQVATPGNTSISSDGYWTDEWGGQVYIGGTSIVSIPVTSTANYSVAPTTVTITNGSGAPYNLRVGTFTINTTGTSPNITITSIGVTAGGQGYYSGTGFAAAVSGGTVSSGTTVLGTPVLSLNELRYESSNVGGTAPPQTAFGLYGQFDRTPTISSMSQRIDVVSYRFSSSESSVAEVYIHNQTGHSATPIQYAAYSVSSGSQLAVYYEYNGVRTSSVMSIALSPAQIVGHYYCIDLRVVPGSIGGDTNVTATVYDDGTTAPSGGADGTGGTSIGTGNVANDGPRSGLGSTPGTVGTGYASAAASIVEMTNYTASTLVSIPTSANLGVASQTITITQSAANWTNGTNATYPLSIQSGPGTITNQVVTGNNTDTLTLNTGSTNGTTTFIDSVNSYTGTVSLIAEAVGQMTFSAVSSSAITLTSPAATNANGTVTYALYRSSGTFTPPGAGTLISSGTSSAITDSTVLAGTNYWYKFEATDSGSPSQTVVSPVQVVAIPSVKPNAYNSIAVFGDSISAGTSNIVSLHHWLGSPNDISYGSGYTGTGFAFNFPSPSSLGNTLTTNQVTATGWAYVNAGIVDALAITNPGWGYDANLTAMNNNVPTVVTISQGGNSTASFDLYLCGGWAYALSQYMNNNTALRTYSVYDEAHGGAYSVNWACPSGVPTAYVVASNAAIPAPSSCPWITMMLGANDILNSETASTYYTNILSFCQYENGLGYKVLLIKPFYYQGTSEANEDLLNQYGAECDLIAATNPTYIKSIGTQLFGWFSMYGSIYNSSTSPGQSGPHPDDIGAQNLCNQVAPTIMQLYGINSSSDRGRTLK